VLVVQHHEYAVVDGCVLLGWPGEVVPGDRLREQASRGPQPRAQLPQEGEQLRVQALRKLLEVDHHAGQVVSGDRGQDLVQRLASQLRPAQHPLHRPRVEILPREVRDEGEHQRGLFGELGQSEHAVPHFESHRDRVSTAAHESPLGHDPVEGVYVGTQRGQRVVVPVDVEADHDGVAGRSGGELPIRPHMRARDRHLRVMQGRWGRVLTEVLEQALPRRQSLALRPDGYVPP